MTITIDPNVLLSYYNSREGILDSSSSASTGSTSAGSSSATSGSTTVAAPNPPWTAKGASTQASLLATQVLNGNSVIPTTPLQLSVKGASADYQALFTAYQGLTALSGLAADALATGANATNQSKAAQALAAGLTQVANYVDGLTLQHMQLTGGVVRSSASTTAGPATPDSTYTTGVIFSGGLNDAVPAFQGNVQFNINVTSYSGVETTVPIDLSQMGSTPRTMPDVVNYLNSQLKAAGAITRFATDGTPSKPETITAGGKTVTLPAAPEQWALQINGDSSETVSFSAPASADAVYVAQTSGNAAGYAAQTAAATSAASVAAVTGTKAATVSSANQIAAPIQQIVKLQTDSSSTATAPPTAQVIPGTPNASPDEAYAQTLDPNITSVNATATGSDGSLYVLANVTGTVAGETAQSAQNVALQKYDSAGNLIYSDILGSAGETSGLSLAVSADGQVAIAGSTTGPLDPSTPGNGATTADSFVALYNSLGEQQWAATGVSPSNNQVNSVTFGADGSVYVAGQTNVVSDTGTTYAPAAGYVAGYSTSGSQLFNVATGSTNANGVAVDGSTLVVAGTNNGDAVLNSYTLQAKGAPTLAATRDLGSLGAGSIAGVAINSGQVVVAGTTSNASLNAGTGTSAFSGRQDAFVAQLSEKLTPSSSDAIAYYGGAGATKATALTVSNGQVYIAGTSTGGLPGLTDQGTQEGFVANVNIATGQVPWSQSIYGQDGYDAPQSIAVANSGASVLDRLGLPNQTLDPAGSQLLTATTAVSAGDQFSISTRAGGTPTTVTISAEDTPQTLAHKIIAASGYQVKVAVIPLGGVDQIKITPQTNSEVIQLLPGPSGKDALGPLGLLPGIIQTAPAVPAKPKVNPDRGAAPVAASPTTPNQKDSYGLNIAQDFDLSTTAGLQAAQKAVNEALTTLQVAYTNLVNTTNPTPASAAITGSVPAYLQAELANYKAGLARLTQNGSSSGGTGTSSSSSGLASLFA